MVTSCQGKKRHGRTKHPQLETAWAEIQVPRTTFGPLAPANDSSKRRRYVHRILRLLVIRGFLDISNEVGHVKSVSLFFYSFRTHSCSCAAPLFLRTSAAPQFLGLFSLSNLRARFVSLHRLGVAHQTSLRSRATMMISSNSPQGGRRVAYSLDPVTVLQDHCRDQASPHGHYRFPAALFLDGRTLRNRSGHAS